MLIALIISFTNYSLEHLFDYTFVGFENYIELFTNSVKYPMFWSSLKTTFFYILLTVPANIILALIVSALLNSKIKGEKFFKTIFYIPSVTVGVAIMVMWQQMLAPDGLINQIFSSNVDFLNDDATALTVFAFMSIWGGLGYNVLIMLSAMKNIDPSLYEAAEIDGAGAVQKFLHVGWPLLKPTTIYVLTISIYAGLSMFTESLMIFGTNNSPKNYGLTIVGYLYRYGFERVDKFGFASAVGLVLLAGAMVITVAQLYITGTIGRRKEA